MAILKQLEGTHLIEENVNDERSKTKLTDYCEGTVDVTVGICVKNSERTIKEALVSVLNQTFNKKCMEIIVVDDGSSDRTLKIIERIASKADIKVKLYYTGGYGIAFARQMVVDNSCGNFIVFVDGDMILPKDFIQTQFDVMQKNPLIGAAGANIKARLNRSVLADLESISQSREHELGIHRNWRLNPKKLGTGGTIFRLAALRKAGGFDKSIKGAAEDADITARIKEAGYFLYVSRAEFEHEFKQTLRDLWKQYAWYGYGMHHFYHKHHDLTESAYVYFWPVSFMAGVIRSIQSFKNTRRKRDFFLPFHNCFRATAWWFGFLKAHKEGYGHEYKNSNQER